MHRSCARPIPLWVDLRAGAAADTSMRWARWIGGLLLVGGLSLVGGAVALHEPLPRGEAGERADQVARELERWAGGEAWATTRWVKWTFRGVNEHVWDRARGFVRVGRGTEVVWLKLSDRTGVVERDGVRLHHHAARRGLKGAYARWANDSFWLNPLAKLFDPGTRREWVDGDDGGLLVIYESGGVTPGDAYLWELDAAGAPVAWRMWVDIIPLGGVRATWEDWIEIGGGVRISTRHELPPLGSLEITDVAGGSSYRDLGLSADPFERLEAKDDE